MQTERSANSQDSTGVTVDCKNAESVDRYFPQNCTVLPAPPPLTPKPQKPLQELPMPQQLLLPHSLHARGSHRHQPFSQQQVGPQPAPLPQSLPDAPLTLGQDHPQSASVQLASLMTDTAANVKSTLLDGCEDPLWERRQALLMRLESR